MDTRNPALNERALERIKGRVGGRAMTVGGAIQKAAILTFALVVSAGYTWWAAANDPSVNIGKLILIGAIGGLIVGLVTTFKPDWSPVTAPMYAMLEGVAIGGISMVFSDVKFAYEGIQGYPGIVPQAAALTFGVLGMMLILYRTGLIRATAKFRAVMLTAMAGILGYYLISMLAGMFGVSLPLIHSNGLMGIGFSVIVCTVAGFSLILDFDAIEQAAKLRAPDYYEWYTAFGLLVGVVWLYLEMLRLLAKLSGRKD